MLDYSPEPTPLRLHLDDSFVRGIMGPFGSGKSVACCQDVWFRSQQQRMGPYGKRRSRWAFVRNTFPQLMDTTLRTWLDWFPDGIAGVWHVTPRIFELKYGDVHAEIMFRALDRPDDIRNLLSLELTGAFVNEAREIPWAIIEGLTGRVGRYPPLGEEGCSWQGIIMDTNPPDDDHWWYRVFEDHIPPGSRASDMTVEQREQIAQTYKLFRQPPAVIQEGGVWVTNPKAENLSHLTPGYYDRMVVGKDQQWINVYARGMYGIVQEGKSVYPGYNEDDPQKMRHLYEFEVDPQLPVYVGWDCSLNGQACVLAQLSKGGQLRVFDEFVSERSGSYQFISDHVQPQIAARYPKLEFAGSFIDPAAIAGANTDEKHSLGVLNNLYADQGMKVTLPFHTFPAPTNSLQSRIDAVKMFLNHATDDGAPKFILHPRCVTLRKGFLGRYEFGRVQIVGEDRSKDVPKKNRFSHPHDALQYLCLGIFADYEREDDDEDERRDYRGAVSSVSGY